MTGIYPYKVGIQRVLWPWNQHGIEKKFKLLPAYLKENGYQTAIFGKWNLGHAKKEFLPTRRGFDYHYGSYTGAVDHYTHKYYGVHDLLENEKSIYDQGHICDLLTDKVIDKIKKREKQKPFFFYIPFNSPHDPIKYPSYFDHFYIKMKNRKRAAYLAMVQHLDYSIGRIFSILETEKILEDTLIWFTSDNGGWIENGSQNIPLAGGKANEACLGIGDGSIKAVNFIYCHNLDKGKICQNNFHAIDVLPTLCKIANCNNILNTDGIDILSNLENKDANSRILIHILMGNDEESFFGCCRKNNYKFICRGEKEELYDTESDPYEKQNLIGTKIDIESELRDFLKNNFHDYKPNPVMWTQPNGYPNDYKFPPSWDHTNETKAQIKMLQIEQKHFFDFENDSAINILGYYNLINHK